VEIPDSGLLQGKPLPGCVVTFAAEIDYGLYPEAVGDPKQISRRHGGGLINTARRYHGETVFYPDPVPISDTGE
jgi:hypothetical protein